MINFTDCDVVVVLAGVAGLPATLFTGAMGARAFELSSWKLERGL